MAPLRVRLARDAPSVLSPEIVIPSAGAYAPLSRVQQMTSVPLA